MDERKAPQGTPEKWHALLRKYWPRLHGVQLTWKPKGSPPGSERVVRTTHLGQPADGSRLNPEDADNLADKAWSRAREHYNAEVKIGFADYRLAALGVDSSGAIVELGATARGGRLGPDEGGALEDAGVEDGDAGAAWKEVAEWRYARWREERDDLVKHVSSMAEKLTKLAGEVGNMAAGVAKNSEAISAVIGSFIEGQNTAAETDLMAKVQVAKYEQVGQIAKEVARGVSENVKQRGERQAEEKVEKGHASLSELAAWVAYKIDAPTVVAWQAAGVQGFPGDVVALLGASDDLPKWEEHLANMLRNLAKNPQLWILASSQTANAFERLYDALGIPMDLSTTEGVVDSDVVDPDNE